jgi:hypothetical protein
MEPARDGGGVIEYRDSNQMVEATWVIFFHDQDRSPEMFTDEAAARRRLEQCKLAWTCDLFAHERELAEKPKHYFESAGMALVPREPTDEMVSVCLQTFRHELDVHMDTKHGSASPGHDSMRIALREMLKGKP